MTASATGRFDPARVAHLSGRFAPVTEEVAEAALVVEGELPADLDRVPLGLHGNWLPTGE
ncbi:hypothetical protein [Streptomyces bauhiniae]|uniref:Dioxygenase n=1 Tax=Streptomyces bauhiniae TaxID=2340725 RepID=A0A7K3QNU8_9ACTN|nr:hypothetical protein [Streptomyces bauhiniae]NEB91522.1 hypothetical protein [Streptomyces bauhiniae]